MIPKRTAKEYVKEYALIIIGAAIYGVGFQFFFYPNQVLAGGLTGIAMIINMLTDLPVGVMNIIMNTHAVKLGPELEEFRNATRPLPPPHRGHALDTNDFIRAIHNSVARYVPRHWPSQSFFSFLFPLFFIFIFSFFLLSLPAQAQRPPIRRPTLRQQLRSGRQEEQSTGQEEKEDLLVLQA